MCIDDSCKQLNACDTPESTALDQLKAYPDLEFVRTSPLAVVRSFKSGSVLLLSCHQNETYCIYRYGMETFMPDQKNQRHFFEMIALWFRLHTHKAALHDPVHVGAFAGSYLERRDWDHP